MKVGMYGGDGDGEDAGVRLVISGELTGAALTVVFNPGNSGEATKLKTLATRRRAILVFSFRVG